MVSKLKAVDFNKEARSISHASNYKIKMNKKETENCQFSTESIQKQLINFATDCTFQF